MRIKSITRNLAVAAVAACLVLLLCHGIAPAMAQSATDAKLSNIVPPGVAVFFQATIKSLDPVTRDITLVGPSGDTDSVVAGPAVRFSLLKAGDTVNVEYYRSVAFIVSQPGETVPPNQIAAVLARPVKAPGGLAIKQTTISGTVVGIDLEAYTIEVVNPKGGRVWTLEVTDPVRRAHLPLLKVGDTITAVVSEALAVTISPAK